MNIESKRKILSTHIKNTKKKYSLFLKSDMDSTKLTDIDNLIDFIDNMEDIHLLYSPIETIKGVEYSASKKLETTDLQEIKDLLNSGNYIYKVTVKIPNKIESKLKYTIRYAIK